jgi:hypothetical protein
MRQRYFIYQSYFVVQHHFTLEKAGLHHNHISEMLEIGCKMCKVHLARANLEMSDFFSAVM